MSTNPINGKIFYIGAARLSDKIIVANVSYNGKEIDNTPVRQMLISMTEITSRKLYAFSLGSYSWGVMEVDGLCYVVATAVDYPTRVMAKCLQDTAKLFVTRVQETWKTCKEDGLSDTSRKTLLQLCERYDDLAEQDKLAKTMAKVDEVKVQMEANISQALENCVQLEKLENDSGDTHAPHAWGLGCGAAHMGIATWILLLRRSCGCREPRKKHTRQKSSPRMKQADPTAHTS